MAKRRQYFIDVSEARKFLKEAYGLESKEVNFYHLKVWHPEFEGRFNWYHTQGTITVEATDYAANCGHAADEEELAIIINHYVIEKQTAYVSK